LAAAAPEAYFANFAKNRVRFSALSSLRQRLESLTRLSKNLAIAEIAANFANRYNLLLNPTNFPTKESFRGNLLRCGKCGFCGICSF